jgi:separase
MKPEVKSLDQRLFSRAVSLYKEADGDYQTAVWQTCENKEDQKADAAREAYRLFKEAIALANGTRQMHLLVKKGAAAVRMMEKTLEDAEAIWDDIRKSTTDPRIIALCNYEHGCALLDSKDPGDALDYLLEALDSSMLDSVRRSNAALQAAVLAGDAQQKFDLVRESIGVTYSMQLQTSSPCVGEDVRGSSDDSNDEGATVVEEDEELGVGGAVQPLEIPSHWTVVSISMVEREGEEAGLLVTRLEGNGAEPMVELVEEGAGMIQAKVRELNRIVAESDETTKRKVSSTKDKKRWWDDRQRLDNQLKDLLCAIENDCFGAARDILRPNNEEEWSAKKAVELLKKAETKTKGKKKKVSWGKLESSRRLGRILSATPFYTDEHLEEALKEECRGVCTLTKEQCKKFRKLADEIVEEQVPGKNLILVLGKGLERIPWESLPILRECSVSRMPSLDFLSRLETNPRLVNPGNGYYILNPSADLTKTQSVFEEEFLSKGWTGIAGVAPTQEQFLGALNDYDVFVYCGHNSGEQYLRREFIEQKLNQVKPVSLLMGCSSAALKPLGTYDASGIVQSYVQADCPSVVGNLFDVTDADIDRYLLSMLEDWLEGDEDLIHSVSNARKDCKLTYLVGSSPVVYGLPTTKLCK